MSNKELLKEFNALPNDVEKWKWVKEHQETGIVIMLDNDDTFGTLPDPDDEDDVLLFQFEEYIGSGGVKNLLEVLGIKGEGV